MKLIVSAAIITAPLLASALPPRYDHVVIVVMENINGNEIPGAATAPYLNSLITQGATLSNAYGFIHTSAPNYGELFSGSKNGITDDGVSPGVPFTTPNLGAELRQNGYTFSGFAQSLPSIGYTGLASGAYVRGHNPWVNWQNDAPNADPNQLPSTTNLPFTLFPTSAAGFATLPTVSFITPDNDHNMHNGSTLAQRLANGDNFVKNSLDGYYQWAKANNSLLIITADEDDRNVSGNYDQIPTIIAGANVRAGATVAQPYTLHDVLRTVEDMYALPHAANAATARPITGAFAGDPAVNIKTFQNGANSYTSAHDTQIRADAPTTGFGATTPLTIDLDAGSAAGNQPVQTLIRFDNISGSTASQIPSDATVLSAKLKLWTTNPGATATAIHLHRMLTDWNDSSTWNSVGGGISADDVKAAATADFTYAPTVAGEPFYFDVSNTVQSWIDGAPNYGWAILPSGADDYQFNSSEAATLAMRPQLEVAYALYPRFIADAGSWNTAANWANGTPSGPAAVARFLSRATPATLTLDGDKTIGSLILDSPAPYTLTPGTGGTLTFANYGNIASITLKQGQHTLAVPLNFADPTTIDIAASGQLDASAGATLAAGKSLTKTGPGVFNVTNPLLLSAASSVVVAGGEMRASSITGAGTLAIQAGASMKLTGATSESSRLTSVALDGATGAWTGKLDLENSALVLDYTGASPIATIANQIQSARAAGWTGNGIGSSSAATSTNAAIGIAEAANVLHLSAGQTAQFLGQQVDSTSLLLRYTLIGDADLDGAVGFSDLVAIAQHYGTAAGANGWSTGDFNYDGQIDFADLVALAQNYSGALPSSAAFANDFDADVAAAFAQASVPEPATLPITMLALTGLIRRKRRATH
jgi:hypothetical protein